MKPKQSKLLSQWLADEQAPFSGWDFSYLKHRFIQERPCWDYVATAKRLLKKSNYVLDMATGGGEVFSALAPFPAHTVAIEGWKPNVVVARKRLKPFGVKVIEANELHKLPFANGEFDLVLNRHGGINQASAKEIYRVLCNTGLFLIQQIEDSTLKDLCKEFGANQKWSSHTFFQVKKYFVKAGFHIEDAKHWSAKLMFNDVGAFVYFLKAIPWLVPGFSVKKHFKALEKLQKKLDSGKKLVFVQKSFLVLVRKEQVLE